MDNGSFARQRKKSKTIIMVRLAAAVLILAAGAGILLGQYFVTERSVNVIDENQLFSDLDEGDYAKIVTDQHYDSGYFFYTDDEDKPDSYVYFIFNETEIIVAESKGDYRDDEVGVEREFKGVLEVLEDPEDYAENLAYYLDAFEITYDKDDVAAYLPYYFITIEQPDRVSPWGLLLLGFGFVVLVINLLALRASGKLKKRMDAYGIDERAFDRLEQELAGGDCDAIGKVILTRSYIYNQATGAVSLFPLKEIVWVHQTITQNRYNGIPTGKTYNLQIYFSDGETLGIPGKKAVIEGAIDTFVRRCPQALIGFSPERQKAWAQDKEAIIRASRERAAELGLGDEEERYAGTDSFYDRSESVEA